MDREPDSALGEGAERPGDVADEVVPAHGTRTGTPALLRGEHRLFQRRGRPVVHDVCRQRPGQRHNRDQPHWCPKRHDGTGNCDPEIDRRVGATTTHPSPNRPITSEETADPATRVANSNPTVTGEAPRSANSRPSRTEVNPYPAARRACAATTRRPSSVSRERRSPGAGSLCEQLPSPVDGAQRPGAPPSSAHRVRRER